MLLIPQSRPVASAPAQFPEVIMRVLSASVEPMRMRDIHVEVEALIGQPVSRSWVKNWLANHVRGDQAPLVRLGRGRYCLAT